MSIPGRSYLCWTPESLVGRLACVARQVSPGRVCHLTSSSLTHSLPVFLDFGSVSPGLLLADCGWTAMSLFLTCHWFLAVFCRAKTSCARILVSQMFFQHLVTGGVHLSLFIQLYGFGHPHPVPCPSGLVFALAGSCWDCLPPALTFFS